MKEMDLEKIKNYIGADLREYLPKTFFTLYQRICYEVIRFLNESDEKILFFRLPFEELSNKAKQQDKYWREICDVIALSLRVSLKREKINPCNLSYPGDWYNENDKFLLIPKENDEEQYYYIHCEQKKLRFIRENKQGKGIYAPTKQEKNNKIRTARALYRLNSIPGQLRNGFKDCCREILELNSYLSGDSYSSGMLICSPCPTQLLLSGNYILPTVDILNSNSDLPQKDVVVVVGDNVFGRLLPLLNSLEPYGPTKKIVVFGSQLNQELINRNPKIVTLTFLEFHNYCAPKNVYYHKPEFVEIDFPWLNDSLIELKDILEKYQDEIKIENARYIYNFSRKVFADIDFSSSKLDRFKTYFVDFIEKILENIYNDNIFIDLEEWISNLSYANDSNPKKDYVSAKKAIKSINPNKSIHNQLRELEGNGNLIFIDAPLHKNDITCLNPITTVMRYHNFAEIRCLYYKGIETSLMKYSLSNLNQDMLFSNNDDSVKNIAGQNNEVYEFRLEDYFDYNEKQNNFINRNYDIEPTLFTDGTEEYITGDILVYKEDETLTRFTFKDIENPCGLTIIYYSQNNNNSKIFDRLVSAKCEFPEGKDINYYSNLWQEALRKMVNTLNNDARQKLCKEIGVSINVLNNHLNGDSKFMRISPMRKTLQKLIENNLLTKADANYVLAARKFMYGNNISFGLQLKDILFGYRLNQVGIIPDDFQNILSKTNLTMEILIDSFLNTKTIK